MNYRTVCAALAALASPLVAFADDIIFVDILNFNDPEGNSIRKCTTEGAGLVTLVPTGGGVRGIAVDTTNSHIYWTDVDNFVIRRANLNGTGQVDLVTTGLVFPANIEISVPDNAMFWGDGSSEEMYRAGLDGSNPFLLTMTDFYRGLAINPSTSTIYWTSNSTTTTGQIRKSNLFGGDAGVVLGFPTPISKPGSLAIDAAGGKMYWTNQITWSIWRANLDGSSPQSIFDASAIGPPKAITLHGGKIFWGQDVDNEGFQHGDIYRMNPDGSNVELVLENLGSVNDMVIIGGGAPPCYANCDGSTGQPALTANDFQCFINKYAANNSYANCDGSTGNPALTANDFQCFINKYAGGCR